MKSLYQTVNEQFAKEISAVEQRLLDGSVKDWPEYRQMVGERKALIRMREKTRTEFTNADVDDAADDQGGNKS